MKRTPIHCRFVLLLLLSASSLWAQNALQSSYYEIPDSTKWGLLTYVGADIRAISSGWNADMGVGAMAGIYLSPRRIKVISESSMFSVSDYELFLFNQDTTINFNTNITGLDSIKEAYFESNRSIAFGIMGGINTAGTFVTNQGDNPPFTTETQLSTLTYIPILASFQHIFYSTRDYQHLYSRIQDSYNEDPQNIFPTNEIYEFDYKMGSLYSGYRLSAGPALVIDSQLGEFTTIPINVRVEWILGGQENRSSWVNTAIFYDMLFINDPEIEEDFLGQLGINWSFSLQSRGY